MNLNYLSVNAVGVDHCLLFSSEVIIFNFWIELGLIVVGLGCLAGSFYVGSDPSDPKKPKNETKKKILRYTLITIGLLALIAGGFYIYQGNSVPLTGFSDMTYKEFLAGWSQHSRGSSEQVLNYFISFNPSDLQLNQYNKYFRLMPIMMDCFEELPNSDQWINTNGQGARLAAILDLYSHSHYASEHAVEQAERAQKISVHIFEGLRR